MNGIFVHLLYGFVQLSEVGRLTVALGCVYTSYTKLEGPVAPYTPGVRPLHHTKMFTMQWRKLCREQHLCTSTVYICTAASSRFRTAFVGCVYTSLSKLPSPVAACTPGIRPLDPQACSLGCGDKSAVNGIFVHLLYGSVQLSKVGRLTAALYCVHTNCTKLGCPVARCTPCVRLPHRSR